MKKDIERVILDGVELGVDFKLLTNTPFDIDKVKYAYSFSGAIDLELIEQIGLGVIESTDDGEIFLYNAMYDKDSPDDKESYEMLRMGVYYQITHPDYVDTKLDILVNKTTNSGEFFKYIFAEETTEPIEIVKEIIREQKGKPNNVVPFFKKNV